MENKQPLEESNSRQSDDINSKESQVESGGLPHLPVYHLLEGNTGNARSFEFYEDRELIILKAAENYIKSRYALQFNIVSNKIEWRKIDAVQFGELGEQQVNSIYLQLKRERIPIKKALLKDLLQSDFVPVYNIFLEYFDSLPTWDKSVNYIKQLAETVKTNDNDLFLKCLTQWFVASVACALCKAVNQWVLVLSGKQGIGKSKWLEKLVPQHSPTIIMKG